MNCEAVDCDTPAFSWNVLDAHAELVGRVVLGWEVLSTAISRFADVV